MLAAVLLAGVPALIVSQPWLGGAVSGAQEERLSRLGEGSELFAQSCASCHGVGGGGTANGPTLIGVGAANVDFQLSTGRMPMAEPGAQPMRSEPAFSEEEIEALVAYVAALGPGGVPIPEIMPAEGDLQRGRRIYAGNCLACHGAGGQGASVGGGQVAPPLFQATPLQVAEAVRVGPGAMPPFGEEQIPPDDLDSLVRYVRFLDAYRPPGGLEAGRVGPVVEGFLAWLIGLGSLVLLMRWIGSRT